MVPIIITIVYFLFLSIFFGLKAKKKVSSGKQFFTAAGQLGWFAVMCTFTLSPLGGGHTTSLWQMQAGMGLSVAWWGILSGGIFVPIFMLWFGPMFRRLKVQTFPQALGKVFGPKIKIVNTSIAPAGWLGITMSETLGIATVIYTLSGGRLQFAPHCVFIAAALIIIYVWFGGMLQAGYMNIVNAIVLIIGSYIAVGYVGSWLPGGYESVAQTYAANGEAWRTTLFNFSPGTVFGIIIPCVLLCVFSVSSEHMMYQPMLGAKSSREIRKGALLSGMINSMAALPFVILGITGTSMAAIAAKEPLLSVPELALTALPPVLIGVLMVALLCALLSTASGMVLSISHVVTEDIIEPLHKEKFSGKKQIWVGRILVVIVTLAAALPALKVSLIMPLFFWCFSLSLPIFINYLIGMVWKVNRKAAWINLIASLAVNCWWTFALPSWCPPTFNFSFYPVFVTTVVLGIVLNLILPGDKSMLRQIKEQEQAAA